MHKLQPNKVEGLQTGNRPADTLGRLSPSFILKPPFLLLGDQELSRLPWMLVLAISV